MEKGYDEPYNEIRVQEYSDGAVVFDDFERNGESHIYLYPDQVKAVKRFLRGVK